MKTTRLVGLVAMGLSTGVSCSSGLPDVGGNTGSSKGGSTSSTTSTPDGSLASGSSSSANSGSSGVDGASNTNDGASSASDGASKAAADGSMVAGDVSPAAVGGCVQALRGTYTLRTDGAVLESDTTTGVDYENISPLSQMIDVAGGEEHGCAARSDGTVWCWPSTSSGGGNESGQLGNGALSASDAGPPFRAGQVLIAAGSPLTGVVSDAEYNPYGLTTYDSSCAVTQAGNLYCWGNLTWIVNGGGTNLPAPYAQAITLDGLNPMTNVLQASSDGSSACAVRQGTSSTEVWCWGDNNTDNLGQDDTTTRQYPTLVGGLTAPTKVAVVSSGGNVAGVYLTSCAIDGSQVYCWGSNANGVCGANSTANVITAPTAVQVQSGAALDGVIDLVGGVSTFCALRTGGTIWCWGYSFQGYAANYGVTDVVAIGTANATGDSTGGSEVPRYLTSDGVYHAGSSTPQTVNCGSL